MVGRFEPVDHAFVDPVRHADPVAILVFFLEIESTTAIKEPEKQLRRAALVRSTACGTIYGEIVVGDACFTSENHLLGSRAGVSALSCEDSLAREVVVAVMVAIRRAPGQIPFYERPDYLVDVYRGIVEE